MCEFFLRKDVPESIFVRTMRRIVLSIDAARRLARARRLSGISRREHSLLAGLASNYSAMIERRAAKSPAFGVVASLAEVLGVSLDWLAYGTGEEPTRDSTTGAVLRARSARREAP